MAPTRREFLNNTALAAAGLWLMPRAAARAATTAPKSSTHGLLFDAADVPRMRQSVKHPRFAPFWNSLLSADLAADKRFLETELKFDNHVKHLLQARVILERTSFVYALTHDRAQADVALLAISKILQFKRWDYFLEGGKETIGLQRAPETTIAMACACDWLDGALDAGTRAEMEKQIAEKGVPPCYLTLYGMKYPDRVRGWGFDPESDYKFRFDLSRWPLILNSTNLKVIPIAGLGLGACLLRGKHPQAEEWLDMAVQSARAFSIMFGSDGSYDEGAGYWGYTALHLAVLADVVFRTTGRDERKIINFPGTTQYGMQMWMPTTERADDCVNFGDAFRLGDTAVGLWSARQFHDGLGQHIGLTAADVQSHYGIIWYDPSVRPAKPGRDLLDVRMLNDRVVSRSGWDAASGVVALRSGGPANHEHADRNSIIFKAFGERLFHDPFKAAYSYTEPHWLLRQTEAHTAVLVGGKGHQYHDGHEGTNSSFARARILRYETGNGWMSVVSDATDAYRLVNDGVEEVSRTVVFMKPDILLLFDRVRLKAPGTVQLRFQVNNYDGKGSARAGNGSFDILRPGASLHAVMHSAGVLGIRTATLPLSPEIGVFPFVEVESPSAAEHRLLTVCTATPSGGSHGALLVSSRPEGWTVAGTHNGNVVNITLDPAAAIPGVTIGATERRSKK